MGRYTIPRLIPARDCLQSKSLNPSHTLPTIRKTIINTGSQGALHPSPSTPIIEPIIHPEDNQATKFNHQVGIARMIQHFIQITKMKSSQKVYFNRKFHRSLIQRYSIEFFKRSSSMECSYEYHLLDQI